MNRVVTVRLAAIVAESLEDRRLFSVISGTVFADLNGDGIRQPAERGTGGRQVFVDLNRDGVRQANEPLKSTDHRGKYRFAGLKPGHYTVRQVLPAGKDQTAPTHTQFTATQKRAANRGAQIEIIPGPAMRRNAAALSSARAAATAWGQFLTDPVRVRIDMELTSMGQGGVLGAASSVQADVPYNQLRDALVASTQSDEAFARNLPVASRLKYRLPPDDGHPFSFDGYATVNRANALALGFMPAELPNVPSSYRSSTVIDGTVEFNRDASFDYNPADGIARGKDDFYFTVLHEIGHILGFESSLDAIGMGLPNPNADHTFSPMPLDLFRLKPGASGAGFGSAVRQWVCGTTQPTQVFYDGGLFVPSPALKGGLKRGDIPLSTGLVYGDGEQTSHWKDDEQTGVFIGIMDPTLGRTPAIPGANDLRALGLLGWEINQPVPGRNVTVGKSLVGGIDFGTRGGDDNDQLSEAQTVISGQTISNVEIGWATDVDLYAFHGRQGEWFSIDVDALGTFDSYLRVVDADGRELAANDNAPAPGEKADQRSSYIRFTLPRDGTFFIGVSGKGNAQYELYDGTRDTAGRTGKYTLTIRNATTDDDNSMTTATPLVVGRTMTGAVEPVRDIDLYRITVVAGQRLAFDIDHPSSSTLDSFLRLFDSNGVEIEANDDAPARDEEWTYESYIEHRFNRAGTYFIGVSSTGNDRYSIRNGSGILEGATAGTYRLTARVIAG